MRRTTRKYSIHFEKLYREKQNTQAFKHHIILLSCLFELAYACNYHCHQQNSNTGLFRFIVCLKKR